MPYSAPAWPGSSMCIVRSNPNAPNPARGPTGGPHLAPFYTTAHQNVSKAHATGAALLPVFPVREPGGLYRVVIGPPLEVRPELARRQASELALRDYAARLAPYVLAYPEQWRGWLHP